MSGEHTPGPWSMGQTGCCETALVSPTAVVAFAAWDGGSGCHLEIKNAADARLIVAAPDLHEVCKLAKDYLASLDHHSAWVIYDQIDAALAKATAA